MWAFFPRSWQRRLSAKTIVCILAACILAFNLWAQLKTRQSSGQLFRHPLDRSRAYVFYATNDIYACSVMVNVHILRHTLRTRYRVSVLISHEVSSDIRRGLDAMGAAVLVQDPPPLHQDTDVPYYKDCLLKLMAFKMHELDSSLNQILVLDSDQLILKNLDDTFDLPAPEFAAPSAYWLGNNQMSSTCMLIRPNASLWNRVEPALASVGVQRYDMDIVNDLFRSQNYRLSESYNTLNSHWEDWNVPHWFRAENRSSPITSLSPSDEIKPQPASDQDLKALYRQAKVLHFSAVGKPWDLSVAELIKERPNAHPLLQHQWKAWRSTANKICPRHFVDDI
ncbi:hypothetical protein CDD83_3120 [Cordyceps sp. RAO-2017]|nr:hypothetical protein CDD83_3120 [Cordyceps sp. RAO-2017]